MDKPSYYGILPATVRYDNRLKAGAKLLYCEISALTNFKGCCWATNDYFAKLYDVDKKTASRWVSQLEEYGYIRTEIIYEEGTKYIKQRNIYLQDNSCKASDTGPMDKKVPTPMDKNVHTPGDKKVPTPMDKNVQENNTSLNITRKNKYMSSSDEDDGVSLTETSAVPNDLPKKKEKKPSKQKEKDLETHKAVEKCLEVLNSLTGSSYKASTKATIRDVGGRLNDGYTVEDICNTFRFQCDQWKGTKFEKHLTPATLLRQSNFERYYNEMSKSKKKEHPKRITYEGRTYEWDDWDHEYVPLYDHTWDGVNP